MFQRENRTARRRFIAGAAIGLVGAAASLAHAQCGPTLTCTMVPPLPGDHFGHALGQVSGTMLIVGANETAPPLGTGLSFLVSTTACAAFGGYPTVSPFGPFDEFGDSVAGATEITGAMFTVIGAPYLNIGAATDAGSACVRHQMAVSAPTVLLNPAPIAMDDHFGWSVAALSTGGVGIPRAIVGKPGSNFPFVDSGEVCVFNAGTGALLGAPIMNCTPAAGDRFGYAVATREPSAIAPALIFVGAPFDDNVQGVDAGAVYVIDAIAQVCICTILPPGPAGSWAGANFGSSIATAGTHLFVGAPGAGGTAGAAFSFDLPGVCAPLFIKLYTNPSPNAGDQFGFSVSAGPCPDTIAIGAPFEDTAGVDQGAVYLLDVFSGVGGPLPYVGFAMDRFGYALAALDGRLAVGAPGRSTAAAQGGGVFIYSKPFPDCNGNCIKDGCDIASGFSSDVNCDGIPDECQAICRADIAPACGDGKVDGADLAFLLGAFGTGNAAADINGDGIVDAADLGLVLGCWGICGGACP